MTWTWTPHQSKATRQDGLWFWPRLRCSDVRPSPNLSPENQALGLDEVVWHVHRGSQTIARVRCTDDLTTPNQVMGYCDRRWPLEGTNP